MWGMRNSSRSIVSPPRDELFRAPTLPAPPRPTQRHAPMSATTAGWLVLLCPLVGTIVIAFRSRLWPGRTAGWIGTPAIALTLVFSVIAFVKMRGFRPDHRPLTSTLRDY